MNPQEREDLLDQIVAEYSDRLAREQHPLREDYYTKYPDLRAELEPIFRMVEAGLGPATGDSAARLASGIQLGDFTIIREIGRGGMGVVYLAEQRGLKRRVALKVLRHHLTLEARHVSRFQREARSAARLKHPNIVSIHSVGEHDGHQYISMDYLPGPTLADVIETLKKSGKAPTVAEFVNITKNREVADCRSWPEAAVRFFQPVLEAVKAAHDAGIVHRDLKPSNILLDAHGAPCVADFGLAKGEGDIGLSFSGEPIGTPFYMAPEQVRNATKVTDARTDVYSLGVTLYELLTLDRPYQADSYPELVNRILTIPARPPRQLNREISKTLERVVMQAMHKNAELRYATVREFSEDLNRAVAGGKVLARRWGGFQSHASVGGWQAGRARMNGTGYLIYPGYEYKSDLHIFGWPLIHVAQGVNPETGRPLVAKGIIAIGNKAIGVAAMGGTALGVFACGGLSIGIVTAFGGVAIGTGLSMGGCAIGGLAIGGVTLGYYSLGGLAMGLHTMDGARQDPALAEFLKSVTPEWLMRVLHLR